MSLLGFVCLWRRVSCSPGWPPYPTKMTFYPSSASPSKVLERFCVHQHDWPLVPKAGSQDPVHAGKPSTNCTTFPRQETEDKLNEGCFPSLLVSNEEGQEVLCHTNVHYK